MRLEIQDVTFRYGARAILRNFSYTAHSGKPLQIVGPNGSGKTTLLMILAGFLTPARGQVCLQGLQQTPVLCSNDDIYYQAVYYVGSRLAEDDYLSLYDYARLVFVLRAAHGPFDQWLEGILTATALEPYIHRPLQMLSAGMRRRFLIALAIALQPALLLLDEPFSVLDEHWAAWLVERLLQYSRNHLVAIAQPHSHPELGDQILTLQA